jgi:hypothetical protein
MHTSDFPPCSLTTSQKVMKWPPFKVFLTWTSDRMKSWGACKTCGPWKRTSLTADAFKPHQHGWMQTSAEIRERTIQFLLRYNLVWNYSFCLLDAATSCKLASGGGLRPGWSGFDSRQGQGFFNVFSPSNAGIVVSNPTQGMDVYLRLFYLCCPV